MPRMAGATEAAERTAARRRHERPRTASRLSARRFRQPVPQWCRRRPPRLPAGHGGWDGGSAAATAPAAHGGGGRKSGGLSDAPRWLVALAGLGIVAVIALALVAAYQLGKDEPSGNAERRLHHSGTVANAAGTHRRRHHGRPGRRPRERRCRPGHAVAGHSQGDPAPVLPLRQHRARRRRRDDQLRLQRSEARAHARAPRPLHRRRSPRSRSTGSMARARCWRMAGIRTRS